MKKNRAKIFENYDVCVVCGNRKEHMHHIFGGTARRRLSDEDGLIIPVCHKCHAEIHSKPDSAGAKFLKMFGQIAYEKEFIMEFVEKFAPSYVDALAREGFRFRYDESYL